MRSQQNTPTTSDPHTPTGACSGRTTRSGAGQSTAACSGGKSGTTSRSGAQVPLRNLGGKPETPSKSVEKCTGCEFSGPLLYSHLVRTKRPCKSLYTKQEIDALKQKALDNKKTKDAQWQKDNRDLVNERKRQSYQKKPQRSTSDREESPNMGLNTPKALS